MDLIHFRSVKYRISPHANVSGNVYTSLLSPLMPATTVAVECDAFAIDITNKEQFTYFVILELFNPGLRYIWKDEECRCNARGVSVPAGLSQEVQEYWNPEQPSFHFDPKPRGRILMNLWKLLRNELPLRSEQLATFIFQTDFSRKIAISYKLLSAKLNLQILCQLDFFTRVAEMARVYGIQFSEVLSRGSQFRVESMLLRLAHLKQFVGASISPAQRSLMPSPETIPLTMEPKSGLYRDPVIVLDFQSLYPSVIIAYNYCFSTCLGRISNIKDFANTGNIEHVQIGPLNYSISFHDFKPKVHVRNFIFYHSGVMPILLEEILNTRIMVKNAIKMYKDDSRLSRILDARQLALKLIANVTYGYSAANFSGRMPCAEVADAVVSKGRETLENAIALVNGGTYGSARVIYGDTDSMFVLCPGSSREEAFEIGKRIANDVTAANPSPMKLKLEKIMHPLILESKKRYVGITYENVEEKEGTFDAKGIETVRRDSCPLVSRILENVLKLIFLKRFSAVVRYLDIQLSNLDRLPLTDFIFSREYRKLYSPKAVVPAKMIAERNRDPRDEPEVGERLSYLIVAGPPDARLIACVREPWEFIKDRHLFINYDYYVHRQVLPALHRAIDSLPIRFTWHRPPSAVGVRSWCAKCSNELGPLCDALCEYFSEQHERSQLNRACATCARSLYGNFSLCTNLSCKVSARYIQLARSRVADALKLHNLSDKTIKLLL
uniref:DNA polymerase n=1 Tax=Syphacia muris TaxID=451379 RepID=A0A158R637_9BILA